MTAIADAPGGAQPNGAAAASAAFDWTAHVPDAEDRGWVENKKYDGPGAVVKAARGLEKLLGGPREKLIRLPDAEDSPDWAEIHGKMGRPAKPEEYGIEGAPPELLAKIHEAGLSKRQVGALVPFLQEQATAAQKAAEERYTQDVDEADRSLKQKWGGEFEANIQHVGQLSQRVRQGLGMDQAQWEEFSGRLLRAGGGDRAHVERVVEMFAYLGRNLGEDGFVQGAEDRGFGQTPAAAKAELASLEADDAHRRAKLSENRATRMAAIEKEMRLREIAFPST